MLWKCIFYKFSRSQLELINKDANIFATDKDGNTSLHYACMGNDNIQIIDLLIEKKLGIHKKNNLGETAFHRACQYNEKLEIIEFLFGKNPAIHREMDNFRRTPLYCALWGNSNLEIINFLIKKNKNSAPTEGLLDAFQHNTNWGVINFLTDKFVNFCEKYTEDILVHACKNPNPGITELFLKKNPPNTLHENAQLLTLVCKNSQSTQAIEFLLNNNDLDSHVNEKDFSGKTLLHQVCSQKNPNEEIIRLLIKKNAKIDETCSQGMTSLHYACLNNEKPEIIIMLINEIIEKGCDLYAQDNEGNNFLHILFSRSVPWIDTIFNYMISSFGSNYCTFKNRMSILCKKFPELQKTFITLLHWNKTMNKSRISKPVFQQILGLTAGEPDTFKIEEKIGSFWYTLLFRGIHDVLGSLISMQNKQKVTPLDIAYKKRDEAGGNQNQADQAHFNKMIALGRIDI